MRIFLIRHGEALINLPDTRTEQYENYYVPLTAFGADQARNAGKFLSEYLAKHHDPKRKLLVWYSPYHRAVQTKDLILEEVKKRVELGEVREHYLLRERYHGAFDNLSTSERAKRLLPQQVAEYEHQIKTKGLFYASPGSGGESYADVAQRIKRFIDRHIDEDADVIIVTHNVVMHALEHLLCNYPTARMEANVKGANPKNADIMLLEGDTKSGFNSSYIYEAKQRTAHTPKDYKTEVFGEASGVGRAA